MSDLIPQNNADTGMQVSTYFVRGRNALIARATWPGDNNLAGTVNNSDIRQIIQAGHYNDGTAGHVWSDGDYNHDGFVNNSDIRALIQAGHYNDGQTYNGSGGSATPPSRAFS